MSDDCEHGNLRRKCETCDLIDDLARVRAAGDRLASALRTVVSYGNEVGSVAEVLYVLELEEWEAINP